MNWRDRKRGKGTDIKLNDTTLSSGCGCDVDVGGGQIAMVGLAALRAVNHLRRHVVPDERVRASECVRVRVS